MLIKKSKSREITIYKLRTLIRGVTGDEKNGTEEKRQGLLKGRKGRENGGEKGDTNEDIKIKGMRQKTIN